MSKGQEFLERLRQSFLTGDGPVGERCAEFGANLSRGAEWLNVSSPQLVRRAYDEYIDAGAVLIRTNTLGANAVRLGRRELAEKTREINLAGAALAIEAAGTQAYVGGVVGPLGLTLDDEWDYFTYYNSYQEQIGALLEGGVHLLMFDGFSALAELLFAVKQARALSAETPIIAQMHFTDGGSVESGQDARTVAAQLIAAGVDVVGVSCGRGVTTMAKTALQLLAGAGGTPVSVYPNAGFPEADGERLVYMASPSYMADNAVRLAKSGVRLFGGCCGTTPEIIRAIAMALTTVRQTSKAAVQAEREAAPAPPEGPGKPGGFLDSLRPGAMPIIAEIDPPAHLQYQQVVDDARFITDAGADAISLADNPLASLKMSNIAVAHAIRGDCGAQTICHLTCRDRNTLGLQTALMGAHALGIEGILAITGDPIPQQSGAGTGRSVFDLNSAGLVRVLAGMNRGVSNTGQSLKGETNFSIGVAFNSAARNLPGEEKRLQNKVDAGAHFIMTQPVFDVDHARRVLEITSKSGLRVFLGFFPLISARSALYLHNEVPGITIPEDVLTRLTSLTTKEEQEAAGLEMASALIAALLPELDGIYLISPHLRPRTLAPLIAMIRQTQGVAR